MAWLIFWLCCLTLYYGTTLGKSHEDLDRLYRNLTSTYNIQIRPTSDLDTPTKVNVSFTLLSIKEFDEKASKLAIVGIFSLTWQDDYMMWNPDDYGGITTFLVRQSEIWLPELINGKPYEKIGPLGFDRLKLRVFANGRLYWSPGDVYETSCSADVTFYPFDVHVCEFLFTPWMYSSAELLLLVNGNVVNLDIFTSNGLWELQSTHVRVHRDAFVQMFIMTITFKRHPVYHIVNILIPVSVMGLLSVLVFLLPAESGERVGFSITVLLAMSVFLTIISDSLPSASVPSIPRMSYLLLTDLVISTLATMCTIIGLRAHHKPQEQEVPRWLRCAICSGCWSKPKQTTRDKSPDRQQNDAAADKDCGYLGPWRGRPRYNNNNRLYQQGLIDSPRHWYPTSDRDYQHQSGRNRRDSQTSSNSDRKEERIVRWKDVSTFFDSFFFIVFLLMIIAKNVVSVVIFAEVQ